MKDVKNTFKLVSLGLFAAIIIYQVLHETGHSLVAIMLRAVVLEIHILPIPYILCDMRDCGKMAAAIIGIAGMMFPWLLAEMIRPRNFWAWYMWLMIKGICIYSFLVSLYSMICNPIKNEDLTKVLMIAPEYRNMCIVIVVLVSVISIVEIICLKPIDKICEKFE